MKIFNRLAGSADEMGGFIRSLSNEFDEIDSRLDQADQDRDSALGEMQKLVTQLASERKSGASSAAQIEQLQRELDKVTTAIKVSSDQPDERNYRYMVIGDKKIKVYGPTVRKVKRTNSYVKAVVDDEP